MPDRRSPAPTRRPTPPLASATTIGAPAKAIMPFRAVWLSDLHFDSARTTTSRAWMAEWLRRLKPTVLLVTGDTHWAPHVLDLLDTLSRETGAPVVTVFGNHDYYYRPISFLRQGATLVTADAVREGPLLSVPMRPGHGRVAWLPASGPIYPSPGIAIVGTDGWGDTGYGDYAQSPGVLMDHPYVREIVAPYLRDGVKVPPDVIDALNAELQRRPRIASMKDFSLIPDLTGLDVDARRAALVALGTAEAAVLRQQLDTAIPHRRRILVLTHVPPFAEASWHEGEPANALFLPFFACRATGDVLQEMAAAHPRHDFLVLCGHTHSAASCQPLPNLRVVVAPATYGQPGVAGVLSTRTWATGPVAASPARTSAEDYDVMYYLDALEQKAGGAPDLALPFWGA